MKPNTRFMPMPGSVRVEYDGWKKWRVPGWPDKAPNVSHLNWIYSSMVARRRPFILIDSDGESHNVLSVVDCMIDSVRTGDKRLYVVYTYDDGGETKAGYGELLFMDNGARLPPVAKYDLYTWRLWLRERLFPRRKVVKP